MLVTMYIDVAVAIFDTVVTIVESCVRIIKVVCRLVITSVKTEVI